LVIIDWKSGQYRQSRCPVCGIGHSKQVLFEITVDHPGQSVLATDVIAFMQCPSCEVRYCDPRRSVDYETADSEGLKYYIEQGAGIDVMLEPLSLVDGRPIKRYLEIGCSFGFAMDYAHRMLGWQVRGFDPGYIAATGKELLDLPIDNAYCEAASVSAGEADLVLCSEVIEHIPDPNNFILLLRRALGENGLLLLTTPNGETVSPSAPTEVILPILSPGHHVILYNPRSIETLLRRNGFDHLRVVDRGNQLQVVASVAPISGMSNWFTRELYRRYLEMSLATRVTDTSLGAGYAYRLLKEHVNAGRYREAANVLRRLRDGYRQRYNLDIERIDTVDFPVADGTTFKEFGERWPFNLCGVWYFLGLIRLLDQGRPELAAQAFGAALRFGLALRCVLNAIGTEDLETAHLCREAEIARLSALARHDPREALVAFEQLSGNPVGLDPVTLEAHVQRARSRLFIDLVNLERYTAAKELIGSQPLPIVQPMTPDGTSAAFAWSLYLLNEEGEFATASAVLARACQAAAAILSSDPYDHETARLFREAEIARLLALARHDPPQALVAFEQLSGNPGGLDPATLEAHVQRARSRLFIDLVNLGHYFVAEEVVRSHDPAGERLTSDDLAAAFAYGVYLLNYKSEFSAASAVFGQVWETAHATATGHGLLWPARFHQALASWYDGDREAVRLIAEEISAPPPDLPPVPDEYQQRLSELVAPPPLVSS
jgi:SAM-dependent methyltransferase